MCLPQSMQRRQFLGRVCDVGSVGLIGLVMFRWQAEAAGAAIHVIVDRLDKGGRRIMLGEVTVSVFGEHIGTAFRVHPESGGTLNIELIEATSLTSRTVATRAPARREPFSLLFRGPAEPALPQRIYSFEHDTLGRFELFLVPIGPDEKGMRYEAVFN